VRMCKGQVYRGVSVKHTCLSFYVWNTRKMGQSMMGHIKVNTYSTRGREHEQALKGCMLLYYHKQSLTHTEKIVEGGKEGTSKREDGGLNSTAVERSLNSIVNIRDLHT
jgi:hypothetical protein